MFENNSDHILFATLLANTEAKAAIKHLAVGHKFFCPISLDIMQFPVNTPDGHTFENSHIVQWLNENSTNPLTREPLKKEDLTHNVKLREEIENFLQKEGLKHEYQNEESLLTEETRNKYKIIVSQIIKNKATITYKRTTVHSTKNQRGSAISVLGIKACKQNLKSTIRRKGLRISSRIKSKP